MDLLSSLAHLIFPTQCLGCGQWDVTLCPQCAALATRPVPSWSVIEADYGTVPLPCWSLGEYEGALRNILLAAKHRDHADADVFLWRAGYSLGKAMSGSVLCEPAQEYWVVPAPSRWRRRWRGREVAVMVADGVARALYEERGGRVAVVQACALRWGAGSQAGRSGGERRSGRVGTMRARLAVPSGVGVVIVDDVVTTGATIREMRRVLGEGVMGVLALCQVRR